MAHKRELSLSVAVDRKKRKPAFQLSSNNTPIIAQSNPSQPRRRLEAQSQFAAFPRDILEHIEKQFALRISKLSEGMERYPPQSWKPRYTLESGIKQLYPPKDHSWSSQFVGQNVYTCISAANTGLLMMLLKMQPQLLNGDYAFHKLDTGLNIDNWGANPSPFDLHAIRRGEIGYHFDKNGALGICFLCEGYDGFDHEIKSGFDNLENDNVLQVVPRDFGRNCFFVKATSNSTPPQKKGVRFLLKKMPKFEEDDNSDEDNVARLFEKGKKSEENHEEDDHEKIDADEGCEEYDDDMGERSEEYTEEDVDDYDDEMDEYSSESNDEMEEADFIGLKGL